MAENNIGAPSKIKFDEILFLFVFVDISIISPTAPTSSIHHPYHILSLTWWGEKKIRLHIYS